MDNLVIIPLYILLGILTGALTGFTGGSGMSVLISGLLLMNIDIRNIIGLSYVITLFNSSAALPAYIKSKNFDLAISLKIGIPAILFVIPGYMVSQKIDKQYLVYIMIIAFLIIGIKILFKRGKGFRKNNIGKKTSPVVLSLFGSLSGLLIGIFGGGGGIFIGILLMLIFNSPVKEAIGISIFVMGIAAIPGLIINFSYGRIEILPALLIAIPSVIISFITSHYANKVNPGIIKIVLGIYLVIVAIILIVKQILSISGL